MLASCGDLSALWTSRSVWSAWSLLPRFGRPTFFESPSKQDALHTLRAVRLRFCRSVNFASLRLDWHLPTHGGERVVRRRYLGNAVFVVGAAGGGGATGMVVDSG